MKFKIGDRVKYTSGEYYLCRSNPLWDSIEYGKIGGTVTDIKSNYVHVCWDNNENNTYCFDSLEKLSCVPEDLFVL